jgi:GNAT superfamily N-acetyltransferase
MGLDVVELRDPGEALERAGTFLATRPIEHNLLLTILHRSAARADAGAFWLVVDGAEVVGLAQETPPGRGAVISPMPPDAARLLADRISAPLRGVTGEAAVAAAFAGRWTERHDTAVTKVDPKRLYALRNLRRVASAPGVLRAATPADRDLLVEWARVFAIELGLHPDNADEIVDHRIAREEFWCWDDGGPVTMTSASDPACGVARVQSVFTPADRRGAGYATACVEHVSRVLVDRGLRCVLYTELDNATSNTIYRRIGYEVVHEVLGYHFAPRDRHH